MTDDFPLIFSELRALMLDAAPGFVVAEDTATNFTLKTKWNEARTKQPAWFGWIAIKKSYVAYHVMPLYSLPELNTAVSSALERRRQGKTCFNFKKADPDLFEDLKRLTKLAAEMEPKLKEAIGV